MKSGENKNKNRAWCREESNNAIWDYAWAHLVCVWFSCPCFRDGISPKKRTIAPDNGHFSAVRPQVIQPCTTFLFAVHAYYGRFCARERTVGTRLPIFHRYASLSWSPCASFIWAVRAPCLFSSVMLGVLNTNEILVWWYKWAHPMYHVAFK